MNAKHTPGPWRAVAKPNPDQSEGTHFIMCPIGALGYWRGSKPFHNDSQWVMNEADANLIASAPELLAALEAVLKWSGSDDSIAGPEIAARKAARAAIAKAKGEA